MRSGGFMRTLLVTEAIPARNTAIRETTANYEAKGIYGPKRKQVEQEIFEGIAEILGEKHIIPERVLLRNVVLPPKVSQAIEAKLEAEQQAQRMEFVNRGRLAPPVK